MDYMVNKMKVYVLKMYLCIKDVLCFWNSLLNNKTKHLTSLA